MTCKFKRPVKGIYRNRSMQKLIFISFLNAYLYWMSLSGIFPIDRWNFTTRSTLNMLSEADYADLLAHQSDMKYRKGDVIFREGSVPTGIFLIKNGKVKKYKVDNSAKEQIFYVAGQGELIGYHAVLSEERYPDSAAAIEDSLISFIPQEDFMSILQRSPAFTGPLVKA